ncbi:MAG: SDR family NAD(P)-dependent oxidoreductase, partial [Saprospiraceae bacterium]
MNQLVINVAYIADNQSVVTNLTDKLNVNNVHFNLINVSALALGEDLYRHLVVEGRPCLLIISDNFLKSTACLKNGLNYLQALIKNEQVIPIIIDGVSADATGNKVTTPTEFEKVSSVIKYMNFWQEEYLDLRKLKRNIPEDEEEAFVEKLKTVRSMSSEEGEYLRKVRDTNYYTLAEFSANNFEAFFRNFGDETAYLKFVAIENGGQPAVEEKEFATPIVTEAATNDFLPLEQLIIEKEKLETIADLSIANGPSSDSEAEMPTLDLNASLPFNGSIKELNPNEIDIEALMDADPEWAAANEEEIESLEEEEADNLGDRPLTDTELLALGLAGKLPVNETTPRVDTANEEEEMISLDDLMGAEFSDILEDTVPEQTNDYSDKPDLAKETIEEAMMPSSTDLFSQSEETPEVALSETETNFSEDFEEEEEELEGYFMEEGEETDELEEELSELEVLESANTLVQSGKTEEGITYLREVLIEAPEFVSVRYQYAAFLAQYQNDFKEASNQLAILLEQEPNNISAKFFLGELAEAERDYLMAKSYYEKVHEENTDFPNVAYKLGMLMVNHLKEDPAEAANYFELAYAQNPSNINALYQLGLLQTEELEQEELAIQSLKTVLEKAPEHPFANYDLAIIYHNEGDRASALAYYEKAAIVNPELKTLVNDQAFAIAQEEMENTIYEEEQEEEAVAIVTKIEETVTEEELLVTKLVDTSPLVTSEIATPPPVVSETSDAFEFPFEEPDNIAIIPPSIEEVPEKEEVLPVKKKTKIALITGATSGIGKATAIKLAQEGYQLILTGRRFSRLFQLKDQFEKDYEAKVRLLPFDIKDSNAVQAALAELEEEWQSIDILINNAGLAKGETAIHEGELGHWDSMIDTNIKGLLYVTREIVPYKKKK